MREVTIKLSPIFDLDFKFYIIMNRRHLVKVFSELFTKINLNICFRDDKREVFQVFLKLYCANVTREWDGTVRSNVRKWEKLEKIVDWPGFFVSSLSLVHRRNGWFSIAVIIESSWANENVVKFVMPSKTISGTFPQRNSIFCWCVSFYAAQYCRK